MTTTTPRHLAVAPPPAAVDAGVCAWCAGPITAGEPVLPVTRSRTRPDLGVRLVHETCPPGSDHDGAGG